MMQCELELDPTGEGERAQGGSAAHLGKLDTLTSTFIASTSLSPMALQSRFCLSLAPTSAAVLLIPSPVWRSSSSAMRWASL